MAYVDPTPETFVQDFPEFEDQDPDAIARAIAVAKRMVDTSWTEGDYTRAIELYVAHRLVVAENAAASGGAAGLITSESLGPLSVQYERRSTEEAGGFGSSVYGEEFLGLLRLNRGGARAI
jgi:hypothetical protein